MSSWAEKWLMVLSIINCVILSITLKYNYSFHDYDIFGTMFKQISNHGYVRVTISSDLRWFRHVNFFFKQG